MHKASGVTPPRYASPANRSHGHGNGSGGAAAGRYGHGIGSSGTAFQSLPLPPPAAAAGGSSSSGGGGGSSAWSSAMANGGGGGYGGARKGGAGGRSGGGAGYREDSFVHKRTSWKYTLDWVSACCAVPCCAVLCCTVLCCVVLCCAVLCVVCPKTGGGSHGRARLGRGSGFVVTVCLKSARVECRPVTSRPIPNPLAAAHHQH